MNLVQMAQGIKKTLMTGKDETTTSEPCTSYGHNAIRIYFIITAGSGTWSVKIQGKSKSGSWVDAYDNAGNQMIIASTTANKSQAFVCLPETFRIVATEVADGATVTVEYELFSV
jgi:hypothetical protein